MNKGNAMTSLILILAILMFGAYNLAISGWGYVGYDKIEEGSSFFYWHGLDVNYEKSVRRDQREIYQGIQRGK